MVYVGGGNTSFMLEIWRKNNFEQVFKIAYEKGIILSGGPLNVYELNNKLFYKKILKLGIPILGICFGHQILSKFNETWWNFTKILNMFASQPKILLGLY